MKHIARILSASVFSLLLVTISSCKKKCDESTVNITVQAYYGTQPILFDTTSFTDEYGHRVRMDNLQCYLAHIQLIKPDNSTVELAEVAYLDFKDASTLTITGAATAGPYSGLKIGVGLDAAQNATNPQDYADTEPLGPKPDMFWSWLKHRFVVMEGRADTATNTSSNLLVGLVYHVGRDTCYRTATIQQGTITANEAEETFITLKLDVKKIFYGTQTLNPLSEPGTQSEDGDLNVALKFADNMAQAFTY